MTAHAEHLGNALREQLTPDAVNWLLEQVAAPPAGSLPSADDLRQASIAFGLAGRRCAPHEELARHQLLTQVCQHWPQDQATAWIADCWRCGSVAEQVAIIHCLDHLPWPEAWQPLAALAIRSNASAVVQAIAHDSDYLRQHADQAMWNRMILKCLFTGIALAGAPGLAARSNATLARQCHDYACERRAARRPVPPDCLRFLATSPEPDHQALIAALDDQRDLAVVACAQGDDDPDEWARLHADFLVAVQAR